MPRLQQSSAGGFTLIDTLITLLIIGTVMSIGAPLVNNELNYLRVSGDARNLANTVALAKMRAAATFTQARVYVDLSQNTFHIETWKKTAPTGWVTSGATTWLSSGISFGYSAVSSPPANTQATIGQAATCRTSDGSAVGNTACVVFSSRGVPILASTAPSGSEAPTAIDALYIASGTEVHGVTISATGLIRLWKTYPSSVNWTMQ